MEKWVEITGDRETYLISNMGVVRTSDRVGARGRLCHGRTLKGNLHSSGYFRVWMNLCGKGKPYLVHRLVAKYFIPNPNNYTVVNHIDGNKKNNSASNLKWCTRAENKE